MKPEKNACGETIEILIVEDSPTQAEQLKYILEQHGYKVSAANNGKQALALLDKHKPTLVISDIVMPEMDGYELCRQIKSKATADDVPVILLTSLSDAEDVLEGLACGADNFITKPYNEEYLLSSIEQILANKKLRKGERVRIGVEIVFAGKKRFITAEQQQMLTLLISTYEAAIQKNKELAKTQEELRLLNEHLEDLVKERTAALTNEITERKREEEALRQSDARFRILFEQAADIILQLEITPEGMPVIREANSATFRLLGYERDELIGQPVSFIDAALDASKVVGERRENVLSGPGTVFEARHRCKDGTVRDFECSGTEMQVGSKTFAISVERDITARKQAEETLRQSEERYRCITQAVTDYIYTVRIANGRPMETIHGEACVAVTGYTAVDFLADPFLWLNMVNKKDHPAVLEQTRQILAGLDPKPVEHRISRKDGKERWVLSTLVPHFNDRRSLLSYEGIIQDITDRKKAEIELKKAHDELEKKVEERTAELNHANKAKSDFLASMSHELRTPLNSVIGFSQVLQEQYFGPLNEKQLEYARDIEEGGNHLLSLINDVLDLSKIEAGKEAIDLSTFNLSLLLKNSFVMIKEKCHKHGIALSADIPAGLEEAEITADERKIKQVVFNLLSNASKFTPDGGAIKLGLRRNGGEFLVVVTDNGIGVPMEYQQKIFEDFYQIRSGLTSKTRGTGLGLALCKRLVEMHGGRIWVVSEGAEKGSAFSFSIPVKQSSKITPP